MTDNDRDFVEDEDLLMEAARFALKINCQKNRFIGLARKAWFQAATEAGYDPQVVGVKLRPPRQDRTT